MADAKVSALDALTAVTGDDLLYVVDGAATSKKATAAVLRDYTGMAWSAATVTTGNVTGVVNTMHGLTISGLTAARDFVLPTAAATGDRIGVFCVTDAPTTAAYVLQIKSGAAGDLINGTDHSSTIWSALLIKGECLIFRCIDGSTVDWVVEYDGRIPQVGRMSLVTTDITTSSAGAHNDTLMNQTDIEQGVIITHVTYSKIAVRRACKMNVSIGWLSRAITVFPADQEAIGPTLWKNGGVAGTIVGAWNSMKASGATQQGPTGAGTFAFAAGDVLSHAFFAATTANVGARALTYATFLSVSEIL